MAIVGLKTAICEGSNDREPTPRIWKPEAASQSFLAGAVLVMSGGYWEIGSSDPTAVEYIACEDGHDAATDGVEMIPVIEVDKFTKLRGKLKEALAVTQLDTAVGIVKETNDWVFSTAATNKIFKITKLGYELGWATGDTYSEIEVRYVG